MVLRDRLGSSQEALHAFARVCQELNPDEPTAHQGMYLLLREKGDWQGALACAERLLLLSTDSEAKLGYLNEIGHMAIEYLHDPRRAILAYERMVGLSPEHAPALAALTTLYQQERDFVRAVGTLQKRVERASELQERRSLIFMAAHLIGNELFDPTLGFTWLLRAHEELADAVTLGELRRFAETWGLWTHLAEVYAQELTAFETSAKQNAPTGAAEEAYLAQARELSALYESRLGDADTAVLVILRAIGVTPRGNDLLLDAERIALRANQERVWQGFVSCLRIAQKQSSRESRVGLHLQCARVLEEKLSFWNGAVAELLAAFSWDPYHRETYQRLLEFSLAHDTWDAMVSVEAALVGIAQDTASAVERLRRQANWVETKLQAPARAFRLHLRAFGIAPENQETLTHLWRLARQLGVYDAADRTPTSDDVRATIEGGGATPTRVSSGLAKRPRPPTPVRVPVSNDPTVELSIDASIVIQSSAKEASLPHEAFTDNDEKTVDVEPIMEPEASRRRVGRIECVFVGGGYRSRLRLYY